jgi:hypothetical protein
VSHATVAATGLNVHCADENGMNMEQWWNYADRWKLTYCQGCLKFDPLLVLAASYTLPHVRFKMYLKQIQWTAGVLWPGFVLRALLTSVWKIMWVELSPWEADSQLVRQKNYPHLYNPKVH